MVSMQKICLWVAISVNFNFNIIYYSFTFGSLCFDSLYKIVIEPFDYKVHIAFPDNVW